jgi:hypothetical protein
VEAKLAHSLKSLKPEEAAVMVLLKDRLSSGKTKKSKPQMHTNAHG